jgi:predicted esterase
MRNIINQGGIVKVLKTSIMFAALTLSSGLSFTSNSNAAVVSKDKIYTNVTVTPEVVYRLAANYTGSIDSLKMDLYRPVDATDTLVRRPCVVLIHGGSFISGTKNDTLMMTYGKELASRGYIAVSINYRLGVPIVLTDPVASQKEFNKAVYRATQDSKAAVRFLRANAETYHIDTSMIICGGYSAGAVTTIHHAYMSQTEAVSKIDTTGLGLLEEGANLDQSSMVKAAINYCGAIGDTNWLQSGDIPIISFHGTADTVVPYTMGNAFKLPLFPYIYGSATINRIHLQLGVKDSLYTAPNEGHALSLITLALSISKVSTFLYDIVNPSNVSIQKPHSNIQKTSYRVEQNRIVIVGLDGRVVGSALKGTLPGVYISRSVLGIGNKKQLSISK